MEPDAGNASKESGSAKQTTAAIPFDDTFMDMAVGDADNEFLSDGELPPGPGSHHDLSDEEVHETERDRSKSRSRSQSHISTGSDSSSSSESEDDRDHRCRRGRSRSRRKSKQTQSRRHASRSYSRSRSRAAACRPQSSDLEQRMDDLSCNMAVMQQMLMQQQKVANQGAGDKKERIPGRGKGKRNRQLHQVKCTVAIASPIKGAGAYPNKNMDKSMSDMTIYKNALEHINANEFNLHRKSRSLGSNRFN